jgi:flavodoxin
MDTLVVYFSRYGNTQRVAEAIAGELAAAGPVRLLSSDELTVAALERADLLIMGSPTHNMNLPQQVRPVLEQLPKKLLRGKRFAAFDTSYKMNALLNRFTAGKRLDRKLRRLGGKRVIRPEIFLVTGREGPLFDGELERARGWADAILARVNKQPELAARFA